MTTLSPLSTSPASASSGQPHTSPIVGSAPSRAGVPPTSTSSAPSALPKPPSKSKPRKRVNTAEKRNQHNAIERQRRETLNVRFISLARLLPGLATHRRPSKSAIVNNSITHLSAQREQRLLAARLLRQLCAERDALAKEVAEWRFANGLAQSPAPGPSAWSDEMEEVCGVENETFGTFANVDGGDEQEDEDADEFDESAMMGLGMGVGSAPQMQLPQLGTNEMSLEQAAAFAATFNAHGLLTPRSSTDIGAGAANLSRFSGPSIWGQHAQAQAQLAPGPNGFAHVPSQSQSQSQGQTHAMPTPPSLAPGSLRSSTASLPFNAFMSDSASPANSASGYSAHVPTPPTTGDFAAFLQQQAQIAQQQQQRQQQQQQHTPSPRSSHSHPDEVRAQPQPAPQQQQQHVWSEQQLLFLRAIQQQQQQQQQRQSVPQSQPQAQNSQPFNPLAFANSFASGNGGDLTPNGASDAYNFFAAIQQQQQQQQSQAQPVPLMQNALQMHSAMTDANAKANNANAGANATESGPVPPPLHRAQSENLEAWRRGSAMFAHPHPAQPSVADFKNAFRAGMGMGMVWEHGPVRAVEGF